jgi:ryanodine receptor 2
MAKKKKGYTPKPLDTSRVELPADLVELTERLAEHIHDTWAALRFSQGWVYGPERDDATKKHPCLVPYAELPEKEKEYDRQTALQSIKAVLYLGYRIEPGTERAE